MRGPLGHTGRDGLGCHAGARTWGHKGGGPSSVRLSSGLTCGQCCCARFLLFEGGAQFRRTVFVQPAQDHPLPPTRGLDTQGDKRGQRAAEGFQLWLHLRSDTLDPRAHPVEAKQEKVVAAPAPLLLGTACSVGQRQACKQGKPFASFWAGSWKAAAHSPRGGADPCWLKSTKLSHYWGRGGMSMAGDRREGRAKLLLTASVGGFCQWSMMAAAMPCSALETGNWDSRLALAGTQRGRRPMTPGAWDGLVDEWMDELKVWEQSHALPAKPCPGPERRSGSRRLVKRCCLAGASQREVKKKSLHSPLLLPCLSRCTRESLSLPAPRGRALCYRRGPSVLAHTSSSPRICMSERFQGYRVMLSPQRRFHPLFPHVVSPCQIALAAGLPKTT